MNAQILDPCCGSRMMWFDRQNPNVVYGDIRKEEHTLCDGRSLVIEPDVMMDFREMPFKDGQFTLVVFDPPHLVKAGKQSWLAAKYGKLSEDWREDIRKGFAECFRVLANGGVLIFKWNETQIKVSEVLALTDQKPLFGHISGKRSNTHWITFMKAESKEGEMLLTTDEIELVKTCDESPEQYDAFFQGKQIGYLRLRHGEFRVDYPDCGDETILYSQEPQGDGCFEEDEREYFLMKAKKAIVKKFNEMEG